MLYYKLCYNYKLYYDRIVVSEGIDVNKASESKECYFCHYSTRCKSKAKK